MKKVYAIIRCETDDIMAPILQRITIKKIVTKQYYAEQEVKRLNDLNKKKNCYYFLQITRLEEIEDNEEMQKKIAAYLAGEINLNDLQQWVVESWENNDPKLYEIKLHIDDYDYGLYDEQELRQHLLWLTK